MRPAVLHLRHLRIRVAGTRPVPVGCLLLPLAIEAGQHLARWCRDPRRLGEPRQIGLIVFPCIAAHDAPHRRVGFQGRGIDRDRAPLQEASDCEALLDPRKHRSMGLNIDQPTGTRDRRVVRRVILEPEPQKAPNRQRIRRAPRDAALRIDALEVPDQQQTEVTPRRQTRAAQHRRVKGSTPVFDERIEAVGIQQGVQSRVKRMARRDRQIRCGDPQRRLLGVAGAHGHASQCNGRDRSCRSPQRSRDRVTFTTGC